MTTFFPNTCMRSAPITDGIDCSSPGKKKESISTERRGDFFDARFCFITQERT